MIPHPVQRPQPRGPQGDDGRDGRSGIALVVFVLASSLMLVAGIKKTLGAVGQAGQRDRAPQGQRRRAGERASRSRASPLILAAPGVKADERGQPIGVGEIVVVGAMEKLGADGVTNVADPRRAATT